MNSAVASTARVLVSSRHAERLAALDVAVLMGGASSEREVSLRSGDAVVRALASAQEPGGLRGPKQVLGIELAADGQWKHAGRTSDPLDVLRELAPGTVFFLALHGGRGEDGTVQGLLDALGRVHTGSGVEASALCMNKHLTRLALDAAGVRVARGRLVTRAQWSADAPRLQRELAGLSSTGFSVKPNRGGSSVATSLFDAADGLRAAIETVLATGDDALVEERIRGAEATCGVLGNRGLPPHALTPVEIVPKDGRFFDYQEKYSSAGAQEFCPPRSFSPNTVARIGQLAVLAHAAACCDGYSRVDFMIPRDANGAEGEPVALEINTLPGMTARSLLPQAAQAEGLSFRALCLELVALALDKPAARS